MSLQIHNLKAQYARVREPVNARIQQVLDHGQFIMGPEVAELEKKLAAFVGVKHCVGVCDGTTAMMIAMMALGIQPGDEVITTPFTFMATGEMIALLGARPVFVDIDPETYNLDPALIEKAITPRTRAILPVSLYGQCADYDAINAIAGKHKLAVIEDAAQSFGSTYKGRRSCGLTTIATTSFFPTKPLGCYGDGGACFTNDEALATRMSQIRLHGQSKRYVHTMIGMNGRLDTLQAAVLLAKMEILEEELAARQRIGSRYTEKLAGIAKTPKVAPHNTHVYAQYTVLVENRDAVQARLKESGIPTAVHYPVPLNMQPAFASLGQGEGTFPKSDYAARRVMSLPMDAYLDEATQDRVVAALREAVAAQRAAA